MSREILLLVEKCSHAFSFYNLQTGQRETSVALPEYPHEFVVDQAQRYAYVGHYGIEHSGINGAGGHHVFQIDLHERRLVRSIDLGHYNRLHGMQMDAQDRLYVLSEEKSALLVLPEPQTDNAPSRAISSGGFKSHLFALSRDGQTAYCMNLLSHTVAKVRPWEPTHSPVLCSPGLKPEGYALSEDEQTLFVTNRISQTLAAIDTTTMRVRLSVPSRQDPTRLYLHSDGQRLLVTNYGERSISVVDPLTLQERAHVPTGGRAIALSYHPTQPLAYVSLDDDRVGIFNLDTCAFVDYLTTQREPDVSKVVML
ncbi:YncE family protein [Limnohabitans sp.]|uniref:YncE family protein n=1 Tax=Limnohabitans sp. TaxID=1907725 RepID=UPI00286F6C62|nr:YncE family protein [Limnohabitans sp.]